MPTQRSSDRIPSVSMWCCVRCCGLCVVVFRVWCCVSCLLLNVVCGGLISVICWVNTLGVLSFYFLFLATCIFSDTQYMGRWLWNILWVWYKHEKQSNIQDGVPNHVKDYALCICKFKLFSGGSRQGVFSEPSKFGSCTLIQITLNNFSILEFYI